MAVQVRMPGWRKKIEKLNFMQLKDLFEVYMPKETIGNTDVIVSNISTHSAKAGSASLFFAITGEKTDGKKFIKDAVNNGAVAVVSETKVDMENTVQVIVGDIKEALSAWSSAFYGFPSREIDIVGVTGTNGKTTITNLIYQIQINEGTAGLIGTSGYFYGDEKGSFGLTTPLANDLHFIFRRMLDSGVKNIAMEVSSHALFLKRVKDIKFKTAIFTNLTQDHLDFHENLDNYYLSKLKLFGMLKDKTRGSVIINTDDEYGRRLISDIDISAVTYGIKREADYRAEIIELSLEGTRIKLKTPEGETEVGFGLVGEFNVYNCLAVIAWAMEGGKSMETVCRVISRSVPVPGRCEIIRKDEDETKTKKFVVVDYAHTPSALENILITLRRMVPGKLICVFGCGGDRDREKRPLMGKVAGILADYVYLTSDNPRSEDPLSIILDIEVGIRDTNANYIVIPDREEAIKKAVTEAGENDCILLAGKGDESYQIIGEQKILFSDRIIARNYL